MKIYIESIANELQRYPTVGDYWEEEGIDGIVTDVRVSMMSNPDYEFLVVIHELIEYYLTKKRGIKEEDITKFDIMFEEERNSGKHKIDDEPGFDLRAPYIKEHSFATQIEKKLAKELKVDWDAYDKEVMSL